MIGGSHPIHRRPRRSLQVGVDEPDQFRLDRRSRGRLVVDLVPHTGIHDGAPLAESKVISRSAMAFLSMGVGPDRR